MDENIVGWIAIALIILILVLGALGGCHICSSRETKIKEIHLNQGLVEFPLAVPYDIDISIRKIWIKPEEVDHYTAMNDEVYNYKDVLNAN